MCQYNIIFDLVRQNYYFIHYCLDSNSDHWDTYTSRVQFFNIEKRLHGNIYIWRLTLIITIKAAFWLLNDALR